MVSNELETEIQRDIKHLIKIYRTAFYFVLFKNYNFIGNKFLTNSRNRFYRTKFGNIYIYDRTELILGYVA